jgi:hypothetical protein
VRDFGNGMIITAINSSHEYAHGTVEILGVWLRSMVVVLWLGKEKEGVR